MSLGPGLETWDGRLTVAGTEVSSRWLLPMDAKRAIVLFHGAGSTLDSAVLEGFAGALADRQVASLRCNFPYREAGRRRPDPKRTLLETVRVAWEAASAELEALPRFLGGHSMGGRMASEALAAELVEGARGVCFLAFPLAGKSEERTAHLARVTAPSLFLHGTRDRLSPLVEIEAVVARWRQRAELHVIDTADHSLQVTKRSGRTAKDVHAELADRFVAWCGSGRCCNDR